MIILNFHLQPQFMYELFHVYFTSYRDIVGPVLQAPAKRLQHFDAAYRNTVVRNMFRAFGQPVATCCDIILFVANWTSAHAMTQYSCTNPAKQVQHHATSTNAAWTIFKLEPTTPNMSQHIATRRNRVAKRAQHVGPNRVAICSVEMLRSFGRGFIVTLFCNIG